MTTAAKMHAMPDEIVVECEMEAAPETLWRALTEEELASDWLGARPATQGGEGPCYRIVEAEPYNRVRYAWQDPDCPDAPPVVTIELEPLSDGHTRLRLIHGQAATSTARVPAANTNRPPLALAA